MTPQEARDLVSAVKASPVKAVLSGKALQEGKAANHAMSVRMRFEGPEAREFMVRVPYDPGSRSLVIRKAILRAAGIHPLRIPKLRCQHAIQLKFDEIYAAFTKKVTQARTTRGIADRIASAETARHRASAKAELKPLVVRWSEYLRPSDLKSVLQEVLAEKAAAEVILA